MESKALVSLKRRNQIAEHKKFKRTHNYGSIRKGFFTTSVSGSKAHVYNSVIRRSNEQRERNFKAMLLAYENGEVSNKSPIRKSKGRKRNDYKRDNQLIQNTHSMIRNLIMMIPSPGNNKDIFLCTQVK